MHVGFATVLFFSFSMYSVDREIAQSLAMAIEEIQAGMNEYSVGHKEMMQQFKSDLKDEYQETRAKLKNLLQKQLNLGKLKVIWLMLLV
jgi:cell shape-determining protein MreC